MKKLFCIGLIEGLFSILAMLNYKGVPVGHAAGHTFVSSMY